MIKGNKSYHAAKLDEFVIAMTWKMLGTCTDSRFKSFKFRSVLYRMPQEFAIVKCFLVKHLKL